MRSPTTALSLSPPPRGRIISTTPCSTEQSPKTKLTDESAVSSLSTNAQFVEDGQSIRRLVPGDTNAPRLNVIIFLEESLGSEFWGCLGRTNSLTPEMDKLATTEGMLFTNIYASGNRTVRGFEGVLSSFPPLPGDSIVKRDHSDNVESIARVLKRDGYNTLFLYGGRGLFDGMKSFTTSNGYDRFIEQKHFTKPAFTTIWGVCDEDIFKRALEEFRELSRQDKPFLGTILSVSNHKPYTYPVGRIPENPNDRRRENAVKYRTGASASSSKPRNTRRFGLIPFSSWTLITAREFMAAKASRFIPTKFHL